MGRLRQPPRRIQREVEGTLSTPDHFATQGAHSRGSAAMKTTGLLTPLLRALLLLHAQTIRLREPAQCAPAAANTRVRARPFHEIPTSFFSPCERHREERAAGGR